MPYSVTDPDYPFLKFNEFSKKDYNLKIIRNDYVNNQARDRMNVSSSSLSDYIYPNHWDAVNNSRKSRKDSRNDSVVNISQRMDYFGFNLILLMVVCFIICVVLKLIQCMF